MSNASKGTPRKRPYDVKRKLERAIARFKKQGKKLVTGGFGDLVEKDGVWQVPSGRCGCVISAYLDGRPAVTRTSGGRDFVVDAAEGLGLEVKELRSIWNGFDRTQQCDDQWSALGETLRAEHIR